MDLHIRLRSALTLTLAAGALIAAVVILSSRTDPSSIWDHETLIDLGLELDAAALRSLDTAPEVDVPGRLHIGTSSDRPLAVTVRIKGQQGSKRPIDGKPALKIDVANGARALGRENLTLNNMVQDPTMLHEAIGYQVYADAGVTVPRTAYVRFAINGEPRGLYVLVEDVDRQFLADRFGTADGILYEGAYGTDLRAADAGKFELDEGDDPGRAELRRLIQAVSQPGDGLFFGDDRLVDTESFLAMMAVQVLIADWDNYYKANNYRLYWHPARRRWFFIPTGIDQTFGTQHEVTPFGARGVLFRRCLESERCTAEYETRLHRAADRFEMLDLPARMDRLIALIDTAAGIDAPTTQAATRRQEARAAMREFILARPSSIRSSLAAVERKPTATSR